MNRINSLVLTGAVSAVILFSGCRKNDWTSIPNGRDKCDYVAAYSSSISNDGEEIVPLFVKTFKPNTFKLEQLLVQYTGVFGLSYEPETYKVSYQGQKMFLVLPNNDTTTFEFDATGKPTKARSSLRAASPLDYKFYYNAGKLSEIRYHNEQDSDPTWLALIKITYDAAKKNIVKTSFGSGAANYGVNGYTYTYDYSKKPKGQYHPDEVYGDSYFIYNLVKHLSFFPELESEALMTGWSYQGNPDEYPPSIHVTYSNQVLDGGGKLVSYTATKNWFNSADVSNWTIDWNCLGKK